MKYLVFFVALLLCSACARQRLHKVREVDAVACRHVALRIKNTGNKTVYKYLVFAGKQGIYEFPGLRPDSVSGYQCLPAFDKVFNSNFMLLLGPTDTVRIAPDPTNSSIPEENLIEKGVITLLVSCSYQDSPKHYSNPVINIFTRQDK